MNNKETKKASNTDDIKKKAQELNMPFLRVAPKKVDSDVIQLISEDIARKYNMVVFEKDDITSVIRVAMLNPQDLNALNILRFMAQKDDLNIETYLVSENVLEELLNFYGSADKAIESAVQALGEEGELLEGLKGRKTNIDSSEISENLKDAPVSKLVRVIIRHALEGGASDIHIEPIDKIYRVRFRVDGILHASLTFPSDVGRAVTSRIKILSSLKIDEKRKPQDGRFRIIEKGNAVDFRVSTLPVVEGEKIVMRVLEKDKQSFDLKKLGLMGSQYDMFLEHIRDPFGMILMTGPTGSGKSTTLYAFLSILNGEDGNIITLEDPVEYFIPGINQSQVKPEIGYTFSSGLRSILRQDPDVIMVGEIRDGETAELAIHAALTGHLVFSTVHTNNAIGAVPRLIDMGIEPFLIGSSIRLVAAQRLLRRICTHCKVEQKIPSRVVTRVQSIINTISKEECEKYGLKDLDLDKLTFYKGAGCEECGGLGLKGRVAIYEIIPIDHDMEEVISNENGNVPELEKLIEQKGYLSLKKDGLLKVLLGLTTLTELERVTEGSLLVGGNLNDIDDVQENLNKFSDTKKQLTQVKKDNITQKNINSFRELGQESLNKEQTKLETNQEKKYDSDKKQEQNLGEHELYIENKINDLVQQSQKSEKDVFSQMVTPTSVQTQRQEEQQISAPTSTPTSTSEPTLMSTSTPTSTSKPTPTETFLNL